MSKLRKVAIIGATGSIGENTLQVIRSFPDRIQLVGVAAGSNADQLSAIQKEFQVEHVELYSESGIDGLIRIATLEEADTIIMAATGTVCLKPTLEALRANKRIGLASKEILVLAGDLILEALAKSGGELIPVDSEHNAIFQCLQGFDSKNHLKRILLTASGGPFLETSLSEMKQIAPEDALKHPNWEMGPKITIDSATMANKGLEMIEAKFLFDLSPDQIDVVVHPQSIIHSMIEGVDGSVLAQLCPPSMTFPIQHAIFYPERPETETNSLDFTKTLNLELRPPDLEKFPCLRLARQTLEEGNFAPGVFNSANQVAVQAFLEKQIPFLAIPRLIEQVLDQGVEYDIGSIDGILASEKEAIRESLKALEILKAKI